LWFCSLAACASNFTGIRRKYKRTLLLVLLDSKVSAEQRGSGYTLGVKTAISIPNDLFDGAERLARRTRRSRSRLFTDALREYLVRRAPDKITESMDQAIMEVGEGKDEFVSSAARGRLERTEW
jgi:metal-responsive CopG/Arc/MetJ family transcriptional regulator